MSDSFDYSANPHQAHASQWHHEAAPTCLILLCFSSPHSELSAREKTNLLSSVLGGQATALCASKARCHYTYVRITIFFTNKKHMRPCSVQFDKDQDSCTGPHTTQDKQTAQMMEFIKVVTSTTLVMHIKVHSRA